MFCAAKRFLDQGEILAASQAEVMFSLAQADFSVCCRRNIHVVLN